MAVLSPRQWHRGRAGGRAAGARQASSAEQLRTLGSGIRRLDAAKRGSLPLHDTKDLIGFADVLRTWIAETPAQFRKAWAIYRARK